MRVLSCQGLYVRGPTESCVENIPDFRTVEADPVENCVENVPDFHDWCPQTERKRSKSNNRSPNVPHNKNEQGDLRGRHASRQHYVQESGRQHNQRHDRTRSTRLAKCASSVLPAL